jgi:ABC-2 type transport system ATP-binding protein
MLEIKNFSKTYDGGRTFAVKDANFIVEKGDIVAFIGHNGSGKSTTLKAIAGVLDFERGDILFEGLSVKQDAYKIKKMIGYLPETLQLYEFLTGYQFLNFIANVFDVDKITRQEVILKYARIFKIEEALYNQIETYSHGMKQKTAVIALLMHSPKLILLDEPFFGLDPQATFDFKNIMLDLAKEGVSILYSTHVLDVAEKLATSLVIISKGEVVKQGKMHEIIKDKSLEKFFLEISNE